MNTPVNFDLAKLLKEKGFDLPVLSYYAGDRFCLNYSIINQYVQEYIEDKGECLIIPYTSGEGSLYLETINFNGWGVGNYSAPIVAEVVMWLYEKHGVWVRVTPIPYSDNLTHWRWEHMSTNYSTRNFKWKKEQDYMSPTEAYEAAIEYTLKNLI